MVRRISRAPSVGRPPSALSRIQKDRKKPYKVQLESVMARKKKIKLHDIRGVRPVPGYTFLPVGYADLAEHCKELSRRRDVDVAVVSAGSRTGTADPQKLSHHVHRVGYHFRSDIFDEACNWLGYRERNGRLERETGAGSTSIFEKTMARYGSRFDLVDTGNHSAEESEKVKKFIRELFPRIPEADLQAIYDRAWEEGASTVGNAQGLSLSRQVQLATIARIRHMYTDYDKLLRTGSWHDARAAVEHKCLEKLVEWRGEHDHDPEELEEILRETIVIDDDEDESDDAENDADDSDTSMEMLQHTMAPIDLHVDPKEKTWRPKETTRTSRVNVAQSMKPPNTRLPSALQDRWHDAQTLHGSAEKLHGSGHSPAYRITIPDDPLGCRPTKIVSQGIEYTRIPDDHTSHMSSQGHPPTHDSAYATTTANRQGYLYETRPSSHFAADQRSIPGAFPSTETDRYAAVREASVVVPSIEKPHISLLQDNASSRRPESNVHYPQLPLQLQNSANSDRHQNAYPRERMSGRENVAFVDLTTPPEPRTVYSIAPSAQPYMLERQTQHVPGHSERSCGERAFQPAAHRPRDEDIMLTHIRPRHSEPDIVHITSRDQPFTTQPQHHYVPEHGVYERRELPPALVSREYASTGTPIHPLASQYRQPVFGEVAYPQIRPLQPVPPSVRPVQGAPTFLQRTAAIPQPGYGAPAVVQHLPPASKSGVVQVASTQRYAPYHISDR